MGMNKNIYIGAYLEVKTERTLWDLLGDKYEDVFAEVTPEYWDDAPNNTLYLIGNMGDRDNCSIDTDSKGIVTVIHPLLIPVMEDKFRQSYLDAIEHIDSIKGVSVYINFGMIIYYS